MKIYIIHYKKLTDRFEYLNKVLKKFNFEVCFIDDFDRDTLDKNTIDEFFTQDNIAWSEKTSGLYSHQVKYRSIQPSEMCNALSHLKAIKLISQSGENGIILEDDAVLVDNFENQFNDLMVRTPKDFDCIFFGSSYTSAYLDSVNLSKSIKIDSDIVKKIPGKTRTVDGYVISSKAAWRLTEKIHQIALPFDMELNYFFKELNFNVYWWDPGLIKQGSQIGKYQSSIR